MNKISFFDEHFNKVWEIVHSLDLEIRENIEEEFDNEIKHYTLTPQTLIFYDTDLKKEALKHLEKATKEKALKLNNEYRIFHNGKLQLLTTKKERIDNYIDKTPNPLLQFIKLESLHSYAEYNDEVFCEVNGIRYQSIREKVISEILFERKDKLVRVTDKHIADIKEKYSSKTENKIDQTKWHDFEIETDFKKGNSRQRFIFINELGILDLLKKEFAEPDGIVNQSKLAKALEYITGMGQLSNVNGYLSYGDKPKKNPYLSSDYSESNNVEKVREIIKKIKD